MTSLFLLLVLELIIGSECFSHLKIVRVTGVNSLLFLSRHHYHRIPDNETLQYLGFKYDALELLPFTDIEKSYKEGFDLESLTRKNDSPDEIMRVEAKTMEYLQANNELMASIDYIGDYWNPCIVKWRGGFLLLARPVNGGFLIAGWVNEAGQELKNSTYLGIGPGITELLNKNIAGADPRAIVLQDGNLLITYTYLPKGDAARVAAIILGVAENNTVVELSHEIMYPPLGMSQSHQKNWVPMIYNSSVYMVHRLHPVQMLRYDPPKNISISHNNDFMNLNWRWGALRGGTPIKMFDEDKYLGFFHSRTMLHTSIMTTYFMGAFLMEGRPPFNLLAVSRGPLYHKSLYVGAWDSVRYFDYVYYPMNFFFDGVSGDDRPGKCDKDCLATQNVTLILGGQDRYGFQTKINLLDLINSMVPLKLLPWP